MVKKLDREYIRGSATYCVTSIKSINFLLPPYSVLGHNPLSVILQTVREGLIYESTPKKQKKFKEMYNGIIVQNETKSSSVKY